MPDDDVNVPPIMQPNQGGGGVGSIPATMQPPNAYANIRAQAPTAPPAGAATLPAQSTVPQFPSGAQPNVTQAPAAQPGVSGTTVPSDSWSSKVYHGILAGLGGSSETSVTGYDQTTGAPIVSTKNYGPGQQWKNIIAGALTGMAAGGGATGPGSTMRKFGAGLQATQQQAQQRQQHQEQMTQQEFENQQKIAMGNAQRSIMALQLARGTFDLGRAQIDATATDIDRENQMTRLMQAGGAGSQSLGWYDADSAVQAFQNDPKLHDDFAHGLIQVAPHVENGKIHGIMAWKITPDYAHSNTQEDMPISYQDRDPTTGKAVQRTFTLPAGTPLDTALKYQMGAATADVANYYKDMEAKAKEQELKFEGERLSMEAGKTALEKQKMQSEIQQLNLTNSPAMIQQNAQQIFEGSMDPSNLSQRSKNYEPTAAAVNAMSRAETGKDFDWGKAIADYKQATRGTTRDTLNYLDSLTGPDNKSGNLQSLINLSNSIDRSQIPALNDLQAWGKLEAGNAQMAAYHTAVTEVADQVGKVISGSGTTSDKKMQQALDMFRAGYTKEQMSSVAGELQDLLGQRKQGMIGNNRYLQRWYGPDRTSPFTAVGPPVQPGGGGAAAGGGPAGGAGTAPPPATPHTVPPGARPGTDAKGNVVGYQDATGWHQF